METGTNLQVWCPRLTQICVLYTFEEVLLNRQMANETRLRVSFLTRIAKICVSHLHNMRVQSVTVLG